MNTFKTGGENEVEVFERVIALKKYIRGSLRGGPKTNDIVVFMDLKQIEIPKSHLIKTEGILTVKNSSGNSTPMLNKNGLWDYYFFKYVHAPDNHNEAQEEYRKIQNETDVMKEKNEIVLEDFRKMCEMKTYISPNKFI